MSYSQTESPTSSRTTESADGTTLAFDLDGTGPPIILVGGAFNTRSTTAPLAAALSDRFTTLNFDRRGRGESGDTPPYAVEREIEDIDALIRAAGGSAAVFGYSSGATLGLKAAASGSDISKLVVYDAPFAVDASHPRLPAGFADELVRLVEAGHRGDAVELYQRVAVGLPDEFITRMRQAPFRPALEAIAHTLSYDARVVGDLTLPTDLISSISTPTLVVDGEASPPIMRAAAEALVETLPAAPWPARDTTSRRMPSRRSSRSSYPGTAISATPRSAELAPACCIGRSRSLRTTRAQSRVTIG
jgi:pimeloyl-ACP methyl ester carboxylesterase